MPSSLAPQRQCKTASEVRNVVCSFANKLDSGELLTGTPTVVEVTTANLALSNKATNSAAITLFADGRPVTVAIGQAVQFNVVGGTAGTEYTIRISCGTDASPAQTLYGSIKLRVIAD